MTCAELVAWAGKVATPRHNSAEFDFCKLVKAAGQIPVAVGWPDVAIFSTDGSLIALIEVKPDDRGLPAHQELILRGLAAFNVPCFRWSPDGGFVRIHADGTVGSQAMDCPVNALGTAAD